MEEILGALAIGLAGGVAGGLLGIGGGTLYVPALVLFLGVEQQLAEVAAHYRVESVGSSGHVAAHRLGDGLRT